MIDFIRKIRFGTDEEILEILKGIKFELIENINNYRTYRGTNNMGEFEIFKSLGYGASVMFNHKWCRNISDIVGEIIL